MRPGICCALFFSILFFTLQPLSAKTQDSIEITVAEYDNLSSISKQYLEDFRQWNEVAEFNGLRNPDLIHPGQKIRIPIHLLKGDPIRGEVSFLKGEVSIQAEGTDVWKPLQTGDTVWHGNRIMTGEDSSVEITYEDGTSFIMRANTDVTLRTAVQKKETHILRRLIQKTGKTISRLRKATGKDSRYEIHTPSAVAAARGTDFRISVDEREATRSEVLQDTVTLEAMRQQVKVQEGEGTLVRKNEPPLKPRKLLAPPLLKDLQPLYRFMPLEFGFTTPEGAVSLRVMISRDRGFRDIVKDAVMKIDERTAIVGLDDGTYFLQSLSIDRDGIEGLPSETETVQVRINPLPPFIQSPENAAEFRETSILFRWLKVDDAVKYHLQIAEEKAFSRLVIDRDDIGNTLFTSTLSYGTFFFRVSSIAEDGHEGVWSDTQTFTVVPPPPSPALEEPVMDEENIHLRWRDLGDGISYRFQMARDAQFSDVILEEILSKPMIKIQSPDEIGLYFVRTSGIYHEGYEGDFSQPQSFEIRQQTSLTTLGVIGTLFLILIL